ncbi:hypothetical protein [Hymenobacter sediminicola]|uniref:Glycosyltransferase family 39 protein n=1 Tax=Hymenobacter sediminicola TaxID=2761579 RepID=A0A7G7W2P5_9BACT|nr:hypothetical protein [Hymenobacter sediminicola]QNH60638.1 hypothetical protein H4317_10545 [Hymenobacter sediminicola]
MSGKLFRRVLLPALLMLAVAAGLGSYFETNDDAAIIQLLRGTTAATPVTTLYLYFHGLSAVLAWLYQAMPEVPWYALLLYALLYAATAGTFTFLDRLLVGRLPAGWAMLLLTLFFLVAWLEHGFWFNYVRVPILLAGVGVLCAAQRPQSRWALWWGLLAFALSWLIRPSAALLGLLAAAPGAWWLSGRRSLPVLGGAVAWAIVGAVWLQLTWSPAAATFRRLDVLKSNLLDFQLAAPPVKQLTATDSLGLAATQQWLLADSTLINEAFFVRAAPLPTPRYFLTHIAPAKLSQTLPQLVRDYFPLLLLLLASILLQTGRGVPHSRSFWLLQAGYVGLMLVLAAVLKLPPRIALPLLDLWVLSNLALVLMRPAAPRQAPWIILGVLAVVLVPYAYKTLHRHTTLIIERKLNRAERQRLTALAHAHQSSPPNLIVSDAFEATYKAESPFAVDGPLVRRLSVAGWTSLHPSQAVWRHQLTGTRDFAKSLHRLAQRADVAWVLTPGSAQTFNYQLAQLPGPRIQLVPAEGQTDSLKEAKAYIPYLESAKYR